ncbi:hypothetical protein HA402_002593 [Bradysia odoriphaga]|nr:hypothetical protein HA402_002593 [Bradysia odoriphaga]
MTSSPTRWGIMGAGMISHDWAVAVSTLPTTEHQILAVSARSKENAENFAREHNIAKAYGSYAELCQDTNIDVIYIGTIHPEHLKLGKLALDHGKHVLCEKPLCMNVKETVELVNYARSKKLFFMEAIWSRFFPAYLKLKEEIDNGSIGEVVQVIAGMGLQFPEDNWRRTKELGGGTVIDMGTYCCQFASLVFSGLKPEKIIASGHLNSSGADDSSSATIIYPNGKTATLITHSQVNFPCEALAIGTKGTLKLPFPFWATDKLETPNGVIEFALPKSDKKINYWNSTGLSYQCQEVRRCIQNGLTESPILTLDETVLLAEMRESIRKQIGVVYPTD